MDRFPSADGRLVLAPLHSYATSLSVMPACPVDPVPSFAVALRPFRLSPSTGVGNSFSASSDIGPPVRAAPLTCVPLLVRAIGVGSNGDDPVTEVRGAKGCRWKTVPLDIEPERGQVPENLSPHGSVMQSKDVRHVLHDGISGSKLANDAGHLTPQNSFGMLKPVALACRARSFARKPAGDDVDSLGIASSNCSYVIEDGDSGPAPGEDVSSPWVALAQPSVLEPSEVQTVGKQPDPVKEASDRKHVTPTSCCHDSSDNAWREPPAGA